MTAKAWKITHDARSSSDMFTSQRSKENSILAYLTNLFWISELRNMQAKSSSSEELDKLRKNLTEEKMKKEQAVNKLAEIMNRKEFRNQGNKKNQASATELKKKEKECRKLQQDLVMVGGSK